MNAMPTASEFERLAEIALAAARAYGADKAAIAFARTHSQRVHLFRCELEKTEHTARSVLVASVIKGRRHARCKIASMRAADVVDGLRAACAAASFADPDPWIDLPDPSLFPTRLHDLDILHPSDTDMASMVERASAWAHAAMAAKPRGTLASLMLESQVCTSAIATSNGFFGIEAASMHAAGAEWIETVGDEARKASDVRHVRAPVQAPLVARLIADVEGRAQAMIGAQPIATGPHAVLFSSAAATPLMHAALGALLGNAQVRGLTFLRGCVGRRIFPGGLDVVDEPHARGGLGSTNFDNEGVATRRTVIVEDGIVRTLLLGDYAARRLGLRSTGHAGGVHNVRIEGDLDERDTPAALERGLLVERIHGGMPNPVSGDFSLAASGHWVERGRARFPVDGVAIAGNLRDLLACMRVVGRCPVERPKISVGAVLVPALMVSGR